ncbi:MAG: hypothetical protein ACMXX6_02085 [Candidatus Woesearchaeota archaeon]
MIDDNSFGPLPLKKLIELYDPRDYSSEEKFMDDILGEILYQSSSKEIFDSFKQDGTFRYMTFLLENSWLLSSLEEISKLSGMSSVDESLSDLRARIGPVQDRRFYEDVSGVFIDFHSTKAEFNEEIISSSGVERVGLKDLESYDGAMNFLDVNSEIFNRFKEIFDSVGLEKIFENMDYKHESIRSVLKTKKDFKNQFNVGFNNYLMMKSELKDYSFLKKQQPILREELLALTADRLADKIYN